jgi:tRNA G10  N-methylase Trm11
VALGASIRRLSRASNGLGRMFLDPAKTHQDVYEMVSRQISKALPRLRELALLDPDVRVLNQDAKKPFLSNDFTNFVIIHPPYFNLYKYSGIYKFEMLWLGYDITGTREGEITEGFKAGKKELVHAYARDMGEIFQNIHEVLVPGGVAVLMIGDTILKGERINTTYLTINEILKSGFRVEKVIVRPPKFTEASYAATQRRSREQVGIKLADYLVVLRKT